MKPPSLRALQGAVLAAGAPLGWLALRVLDGADPLLELLWHPGVYVYMFVGTVLVFAAFGAYVGRQEEWHRELALHDPLTDLYNPRYFHRRLTEELAFAHRHARPLSLLIADIDWFKRVNDNYGHAVGDQVLAAVAGAFMAARRRGDTVARVGGEELAVILPETDLMEAQRVAERLRQAVAALPFSDPRTSRHFSVTISIGAVTAPRDRVLGEAALYRAADDAMYVAKRAGRNCVATAAAGLGGAPMGASPAAAG